MTEWSSCKMIKCFFKSASAEALKHLFFLSIEWISMRPSWLQALLIQHIEGGLGDYILMGINQSLWDVSRQALSVSGCGAPYAKVDYGCRWHAKTKSWLSGVSSSCSFSRYHLLITLSSRHAAFRHANIWWVSVSSLWLEELKRKKNKRKGSKKREMAGFTEVKEKKLVFQFFTLHIKKQAKVWIKLTQKNLHP